MIWIHRSAPPICGPKKFVEETAAVLNVSPFTVIRDWNFVKAWLSREIKAVNL